MHSRGNTWQKIASEYGKVITNIMTLTYSPRSLTLGLTEVDLRFSRSVRQWHKHLGLLPPKPARSTVAESRHF